MSILLQIKKNNNFRLILVGRETQYSMRDLSSLTRNRSWVPAVKVSSPNHWATRLIKKFPRLIKKKKKGKFLLHAI